jgi:hypothetical protein
MANIKIREIECALTNTQLPGVWNYGTISSFFIFILSSFNYIHSNDLIENDNLLISNIYFIHFIHRKHCYWVRCSTGLFWAGKCEKAWWLEPLVLNHLVCLFVKKIAVIKTHPNIPYLMVKAHSVGFISTRMQYKNGVKWDVLKKLWAKVFFCVTTRIQITNLSSLKSITARIQITNLSSLESITLSEYLTIIKYYDDKSNIFCLCFLNLKNWTKRDTSTACGVLIWYFIFSKHESRPASLGRSNFCKVYKVYKVYRTLRSKLTGLIVKGMIRTILKTCNLRLILSILLCNKRNMAAPSESDNSNVFLYFSNENWANGRDVYGKNASFYSFHVIGIGATRAVLPRDVRTATYTCLRTWGSNMGGRHISHHSGNKLGELQSG